MAHVKKRRYIVIILAVLIAITLLCAIFFTYLYSKKCTDLQCFNQALHNCERTNFLYDAPDAVWQYSIKGMLNDKCKVNVEIVQLKNGGTETIVLEGKNMDCHIPAGIIQSPQANLEKCTGPLKEEIQSLLIKRMQKYILDHVGPIDQQLETIF